MCDSLKTVSIDTITGANKKHCAYWARIKAEYDLCKYLDNDYTMIIGGVYMIYMYVVKVVCW
jgi:hypothetical protein